MSKVFSYYELQLKLIRSAWGTCPSSDIMSAHIINKAKAEIQKANKIKARMSKATLKHKGSEITEEKELEDLKGILRAYQGLVGDFTNLDELKTVDEVLELAATINEKFEELCKSGEEMKATVFMRMKGTDLPIISSHIILGNVKEILRTVVNSDPDKKIFKSKTQLAEAAALDLKVIEPYLIPRTSTGEHQDILRNADGSRFLNIRPLRFIDNMGKSVTCLSASEELPEETQFKMTLRIRSGSPLNNIETLDFIFEHGKNLGLLAGRGSLNRGAYVYKLVELPDYKEDFGGWK